MPDASGSRSFTCAIELRGGVMEGVPLDGQLPELRVVVQRRGYLLL